MVVANFISPITLCLGTRVRPCRSLAYLSLPTYSGRIESSGRLATMWSCGWSLNDSGSWLTEVVI
jgi:hypothetical protein